MSMIIIIIITTIIIPIAVQPFVGFGFLNQVTLSLPIQPQFFLIIHTYNLHIGTHHPAIFFLVSLSIGSPVVTSLIQALKHENCHEEGVYIRLPSAQIHAAAGSIPILPFLRRPPSQHSGQHYVPPGSDNTRQNHDYILFASNFILIFANRRPVLHPATLCFLKPKRIPSTISSENQRLNQLMNGGQFTNSVAA